MNLLIVEWISGGGYSDQILSSSILSEGYAMLRSLISDFKDAKHNVTTFMDPRLTAYNPPNKADKAIPIQSRDEFFNKLTELSTLVDGVYVIAPESGQVLENLVKTVEKAGGTSLNCKSEAIKRVSNKMTTYETLRNHGFKVPKTVLVDIHEKPNKIKSTIKKLGYPVVFKPVDGVSCGGLSVVKTEKHIEMGLKKVVENSTSKQFIIQKQIKGKNTSACVFCDGNKAVPVTLNQQLVTLGLPEVESKYCGGAVPFNHPLEKQAMETAKSAVEALDGLKGYVGVDIVLTNMEPVVMEINPRLTVSFVGLKNAVNFNPAQAIIDAAVERKLPTKVQKTGYTFFSKLQVPVVCSQKNENTYSLKGVVSPPFPVEKNKPSYALVAGKSTTSKGSRAAFYRNKKQLLNTCIGGD